MRPRPPTIYLDNASTSWPKPPHVLDAVTRFLSEAAGGPGRGAHRLAIAAEEIVRKARINLAALVHADDPNRVIHCHNGTDALNIAIKGALREGDHVICSALDHNSVSRPLEGLAERNFITLTRIPVGLDGLIDPANVRAAITAKTRLIVLIHASNVTGRVQPLAEIARIAGDHDLLLLVDAAQTAGLLNINLRDTPIDLLAFPCHKALLAPTGTGALYVGPRATLNPWREGGTGGDSISATHPRDLPVQLEAGTPNTVGLAGLCAALENLQPEAMLAHKREMLTYLLSKVGDNKKLRFIGVQPHRLKDENVGVLSIQIDNISSHDAAAILDQSFGIAVRAGLHCAPYAHHALGTFPDGTIRISPGWSTTTADMDVLAEALNEMTATN